MLQWIGQRQLQDETRKIEVFGFGAAYVRGLTVYMPLSLDELKRPGGRLNKKDGLTRYDNSHVKDKTS